MRTIIVMPAYYAEKTLEKTFQSLPPGYDEVILCDDGSLDHTAEVSKRLGITTIVHSNNKGYGGNQKTLYAEALQHSPDVVVMVHPDNQYETSIIPDMIRVITESAADIVLGNRIPTARKNDMPAWKFAGNRILTYLQNKTFNSNLSEFHTGLRAYNANIFRSMPYEAFSDDFVFDSELLAWAFASNKCVKEVPVECHYTGEVSSINLSRSLRYGMETLLTLVKYKRGYYHSLS